MGVSVGVLRRADPRPPIEPAFDAMAVINANRTAYLALTGNHFSLELGAKTCFDHKRNKVVIGVQQLAELGVDKQLELSFITLHELGHLKELRDDPDGYLGLIRRCKTDPDGALIFRLYNSLMDIYVNRNTANKAPLFLEGSEEFSPLVKDLYLNKAFANHDMSNDPYAEQYAHYLLLVGMGVSRAYTVSEPVREIIDRGLVFLGKQYSYEEFIKTFLVPVPGCELGDSWRATIGERDALIRATILPLYKQLLERDKSEGRESLPDDPVSTSPGGDPGITREITLEEMEDLLGAIKELQEQETMTSQEREKRDLHRQAREIAEKAGVANPKDFADRLVRVQPIVDQLVKELLKIKVPSKQEVRMLTSYSTEGVLDVSEAIRKFSKVQRDPLHADVLRQERMQRMVEKAPINMRLCVLPDLSGSMIGCLEGLRDNVVALAATVATLCEIHKRKRSGIASELAIYGFDDQLHEILDPIPHAALYNVAAAYERIGAFGSTCEYLALEHLHKVLKRIEAKNGGGREVQRVVNIAISLTDGDTELDNRSIKAKEELLKQGVECFGVFLRPSAFSGTTFRKIWGDRGYEVNSVTELPTVITKIKSRIMGS